MREQIRSIDEYVDRLREALAGADPALVQDAVYDATEFLRHEADPAGGGAPDLSDEARLAAAIERFGSPAEVASAYRQTETRTAAALAPPARRPPRNAVERVFGIFLDPHAYGALFYMLMSLATGIVYFTWVVAGLSLSAGLFVLIIGIPFFLLFLATVRVLALFEGRVIEALVGVRMPRRPPVSNTGSLFERVLGWIKDPHTWLTILYMLAQLPLGIAYFTVTVTLVAMSLGFMLGPVAALLTGQPIMAFDDYELRAWTYPLLMLAGFVLFLATFHLARALARLHARWAKLILVRWSAPAPARTPVPATAPVNGPA